MKHPEILDDVTLYDVMYEAGTRLGGAFAALQRNALKTGDTQEANKWLKEQQKLQDERFAIDEHDRAAMIDAYDRWNKLEEKLYRRIKKEWTVNEIA